MAAPAARRPARRRLSTLQLTVSYAAVAFALSFWLLFYIDQVYLGAPDASVHPARPPEGLSLPAGAQQVEISHDGRYLAYLREGAVSVVNLQTGATQRTLAEAGPIEAYQLMGDRNLLLYFYIERGADADRLQIGTYNLESDTLREDKSFQVKPSSRLGAFAYSTLSNNIAVYLEAEDQAGNPSYEVHNVDIMSAVVLMVKDAPVAELAALHHSDRLYYTNRDNRYLYTGSTAIGAVQGQRVRLLGCDLQDTLYLLPLEEPDTVWLLREDALAGALRLPGDHYRRVVVNNNSVFFVYDDYVVDVMAAPEEKIPYPAGSEFLTISAHTLYTLDATGQLTGHRLTGHRLTGYRLTGYRLTGQPLA